MDIATHPQGVLFVSIWVWITRSHSQFSIEFAKVSKCFNKTNVTQLLSNILTGISLAKTCGFRTWVLYSRIGGKIHWKTPKHSSFSASMSPILASKIMYLYLGMFERIYRLHVAFDRKMKFHKKKLAKRAYFARVKATTVTTFKKRTRKICGLVCV